MGCSSSLWASFALASDTFEAQNEQALAATPPDVHLKISLDAAQTTFDIGDTIRLKYEFTADSPGNYVAGARFLDHGQRSVLESFFIDRPAEARDSLHDYWDFHRAIDGNISAPREPTLRLSSSPQFDAIELTHYLRFSKPGRYRLYVITRSALPPGAPVKDQGGPAIASENIVTLRILLVPIIGGAEERDGAAASPGNRAILSPGNRFGGSGTAVEPDDDVFPGSHLELRTSYQPWLRLQVSRPSGFDSVHRSGIVLA